MPRRSFRGNPQRGRGAGKPNIPPALRRANALFASGNYPAAAQAFEQLARRAENRGGPNAGRFALRAGEAFVMAGDVTSGMRHIKNGISSLAAVGKLDAISRIGIRLLREMTERGQTVEAGQLTDLIRQHIPNFSATPSAPGPAAARPALPTNCPGCGAPLLADDVEWSDDNTAKCDYCGSLIRGE